MKENWEIHWKDYYEILQVHPLAEPEVVKAAYLKLAQKYHSDHSNIQDADQKMKDLNEAFGILGNQIKREQYYSVFQQNQKTNYHETKSQPKPQPSKSSDLKDKPDVKQRMDDYLKHNNLDYNIKMLYEELERYSKHPPQGEWSKYAFFYKWQWEQKEKIVRDWLDKFRGGAFQLGKCPYCKNNSVILNKDATVGECIDPNCTYVIAPEIKQDK